MRLKPYKARPSNNSTTSPPSQASQPSSRKRKKPPTPPPQNTKKRKSCNPTGCEETAFEPPPPMDFHPVGRTWQENRTALLNMKVHKALPESELVKTSVTTPPGVTQIVYGDGNCFFRAISFMLTGVQSEHRKLRELTLSWMENHPQVICELSNKDNYIATSNMGSLGEFATEVEIFALASFLNTAIFTFSPYGDGYQWMRHQPLADTHTPFPPTEKAIFLSNRHVHFEPALSI